MKTSTQIDNKTVLIKSLKKIKKAIKKHGHSNWNVYGEMDSLCSTEMELDNESMCFDKYGNVWYIYPWMVKSIVEKGK